ncbi:MAG: 5-methylcytosine-specific restriction endonuclease system specificity protein McrC [Rhizobiales bacterium]|nr:5-methylcytosine-specific restriction endonuclease system specificity protein McrC [Hyphomicrobiales bacterium]
MIPIRNIYFLFLYAWRRFDEAKNVPVGADDSPDLINLLAKVLIEGTHRVLRRGLTRDYVERAEEIPSIRGRVELSASMNLIMTRRPRLVCSFDELDPNVLPNQILRSTIVRLAGTGAVDRRLQGELRALDKRLAAVDRIRLDASLFGRAQLHRNNSHYAFLLRVCELAFATTLPDPEGTKFQFTDVLRDERKMALVFQAFVRNFYAIEQKTFRVEALQLAWDAEPETQQAADLVPTMQTDIVLLSPHRQIILDTKYYASAVTQYYGKPSLKSGDLYQLFSYLKNAEARGPEFSDAEGILLYPAVGERLRARYKIQGHRLTAATVNLDQPWTAVAEELRSLVQ